MSIFDRIFNRPILRPAEQAAFQALLASLSEADAARMSKHLDYISFVERARSGRSVQFYSRGSKMEKVKQFLLPHWIGEGLIGSVWLHVRSKAPLNVKADFQIVDGQLFSIELSKRVDWLPEDIVVSKVEVYPPRLPPQPAPSQNVQRLHATLAPLKPEAAYCPPSSEELRRFVDSNEAHLPGDYVTLLETVDGFRIGDWEVLGTRIRKVEIDGRPAVVLAVNADNRRYLITKEQEKSGIFLHEPDESDVGTPLGASFVRALKKVIADEGSAG